ncbi:MAG: hypothetical protein DRO96_01430 [Candidatus Aenigmatarchaeota archaeon]|nr:MAG: hypothetical protein DRO96_01430 [Candidatus Aenigmarchaeota archaeon]
MTTNKLFILAFLVLLAPMTYAEPTRFVLADALPQNITGGTLSIATYTIEYSSPAQSVLVLEMVAGNNFSENMEDYPLHYLDFDGVRLTNCTELIHENNFLESCDIFVNTGEHNVDFLLQPAISVAPDTINYSLSILYFSEKHRSSSHYHPYTITIHKHQKDTKDTNDTYIPKDIEEPTNKTLPSESTNESGGGEPTDPPAVFVEESENENDYFFLFLFFVFFVLLVMLTIHSGVVNNLIGF